MDLGWLAAFILQAFCQASFGHGVFSQQLAKVHVDWVLQNNVMLICDQDVMNEAKCASLHSLHNVHSSEGCVLPNQSVARLDQEQLENRVCGPAMNLNSACLSTHVCCQSHLAIKTYPGVSELMQACDHGILYKSHVARAFVQWFSCKHASTLSNVL